MGNSTCRDSLNLFSTRREPIVEHPIRGSEIKADRTELSMTVKDPTIRKEVYLVLKNFGQTHLIEKFALLSQEQKEGMMEDCVNINFGTQDLINFQILNKSKSLEISSIKIKLNQRIQLTDKKKTEEYKEMVSKGLWEIVNDNGKLMSLSVYYHK